MRKDNYDNAQTFLIGLSIVLKCKETFPKNSKKEIPGSFTRGNKNVSHCSRVWVGQVTMKADEKLLIAD